MVDNSSSKSTNQEKKSNAPFLKGEVFKAPCPFLRAMRYETDWDTFEQKEILSWKPGLKWENEFTGESFATAHGMGECVWTIVDTHKLPAPYKTRVFFIRTWIDPDGRSFGKKDLKVLAAHTLRHRINKWENKKYDVDIVDFTDADKRRLLEEVA
jgi:hypothetical protein